MAKNPPGKGKASARAKSLSAKHFSAKKLFAAMDGPARTLGNARAVNIVCHCANTVLGNLPRTLGELGVSGPQFQKCVVQSASAAGFLVGSVPSSPGNSLIDAVNSIQGSPSK
jgi:hypothetical protein